MQPDFLIIIAIVLAGFGVLAWLIRHELSKLSVPKDDATLTEWLKSMQITIEHTNKTLNEAMRGSTVEMTRTLQSNSRQLNERLDEAARVIGALNKHVGEMSEVGRGIRSLQEFLQSPKLRGNIGEQVLKDMIGQSFPKNSFHLQYGFKSGVKVDAVLKTDAGLLCIDSKFPMENFTLMHNGETEIQRNQAKKDFISDVKKHVTDISRKYILPDNERDWEDFEHIKEALDLCLPHRKANQKIVDLGSGPGNVVDYLLAEGVDTIEAVDITDEFINYLSEKYHNKPEVTIAHADMAVHVAGLEPNSVALFTAAYSIFHIPDEELDLMLQHMFRALMPYGTIVMSLHKGTVKRMEPEPYQVHKDKRLVTHKPIEIYINYMTEEEIKRRLENVGFTVHKLTTHPTNQSSGGFGADHIWVIASKP